MRNKQRRPSLRFPRSRYDSADGFDREPRPPIHPRTRNRGWNKRKVGTVHKGALQRDAYNRQVTIFEAAPLTKPPALRGVSDSARKQGPLHSRLAHVVTRGESQNVASHTRANPGSLQL